MTIFRRGPTESDWLMVEMPAGACVRIEATSDSLEPDSDPHPLGRRPLIGTHRNPPVSGVGLPLHQRLHEPPDQGAERTGEEAPDVRDRAKSADRMLRLAV